jgi:RNA polymerase sigma-70 factor (ECF subfamily)
MLSHTLQDGPLRAPDLAELRSPMLRFARSRLRNTTLAEDAVSETLLAALEKPQAFASPAQGRAWLFGILRHKLVDQIRQQSRETPAGDSLPETDTRNGTWTGAGAWQGASDPLDEPEAACSQREFLALVQRCCDRLPELQRRSFVLREIQDLDPDDICQELGVSKVHLWVLVHRAKRRLRTLLQDQWGLPPRVGRLGPSRCQAAPSSPSEASAGHAEPEAAAEPGPIDQRDVAAVKLEQSLDDEQAQPAAARPVGLHHSGRALEQAFPQFDRDSGPRVEDLHAEMVAIESDLHPHLAAWRRVLDGIVKKVGEDAFDQAHVAPRRRQPDLGAQLHRL